MNMDKEKDAALEIVASSSDEFGRIRFIYGHHLHGADTFFSAVRLLNDAGLVEDYEVRENYTRHNYIIEKGQKLTAEALKRVICLRNMSHDHINM